MAIVAKYLKIGKFTDLKNYGNLIIV